MYIEYIFIENLIVNFFIMLQLKGFLKEKNSIFKCTFSICILSLYTSFVVVFDDIKFINNFFMQFTTIVVCMYVTFLPKQVKKLVKEVIYYYILNFSYVGIVISITLLLKLNIVDFVQKILIYGIAYVILDLTFNLLWKLFSFNIKEENFAYKINIKGYEISSFLDTGNNVTALDRDEYVIFINKNHYNILKVLCELNNTVLVNYSTVLNMNTTVGYIVKNVDIYKAKKKVCELKKCILVFVDNKFMSERYDSLLGINLYIDKLKGV